MSTLKPIYTQPLYAMPRTNGGWGVIWIQSWSACRPLKLSRPVHFVWTLCFSPTQLHNLGDMFPIWCKIYDTWCENQVSEQVLQVDSVLSLHPSYTNGCVLNCEVFLEVLLLLLHNCYEHTCITCTCNLRSLHRECQT